MQGIDGTLVGQEESVQLVGRASAMRDTDGCLSMNHGVCST